MILQNNGNDMFQHVPTTAFERDYTNDLSNSEDIMMSDYINKTELWKDIILHTYTLGYQLFI